MANRQRLVVASGNTGKTLEFARILSQYDVRSLASYGPVDFPEEGEEYAENARAKAVVAARTIGEMCVADDSGLEVAALLGGPGVYSARYGGAELDDRGRLEKLLDELKDFPAPRRARFVCVAAVAMPDGRVEVAEGFCEGEILTAARGVSGFGYDPIFQPEGFDRAMAELERGEKDALSHRGRALRALEPNIRKLG